MEKIALQEARETLGVLVAQVHHAHRPVTITRHGKPEVVMIAAEDYARMKEELKRLQDEEDRRITTDSVERKRRGEAQPEGSVTITADSREELEAKLNEFLGLND
ncbi:type II toxin-antitoxin system Phd/YefM family antitoxin [Acrocarpospora sp. B8E8]|uniref:type II toxin-antitoxin system Phd/YefM family antitoxin n=1 Tax=Acrocarpospora sp. B8E8 TaxID=3153572 RepID=UPI00325CBC85